MRRAFSEISACFSNQYTLVSELMQSARRAGASYVAIEGRRELKPAERSRCGCGIADSQSLLTIREP
jgi:hypothetical protein